MRRSAWAFTASYFASIQLFAASQAWHGDRLVALRQLGPFALVDEEVEHRAALPPARRVVVFRDLGEPELLVVVGADELGGVDGAALERRVDVAGGDLLRNDAELRQHLAAEPADAELQAAQIVDGLELLAEEAAHLAARLPDDDGRRS